MIVDHVNASGVAKPFKKRTGCVVVCGFNSSIQLLDCKWIHLSPIIETYLWPVSGTGAQLNRSEHRKKERKNNIVFEKFFFS